MEHKVKQLVNQIKKHLVKEYGGKIKRIIIYGSYVRDEATKDSDIDVLVVIDDSLDPFEVRKNLSDIIFDILLEKKELISVIPVPETIFKDYKSPFILNVKEEGMVI
ncbi:MAG: nucleotidyltransferase domain-containing protein [Halobacteriota archaeon]